MEPREYFFSPIFATAFRLPKDVYGTVVAWLQGSPCASNLQSSFAEVESNINYI